jgi:hypothetical protein
MHTVRHCIYSINIYCRVIGITDYETMFADSIKEMKKMHGISSAQVFSIRPRRDAVSTATGVDVHYMTNFSRGMLRYLHVGVVVGGDVIGNTLFERYVE